MLCATSARYRRDGDSRRGSWLAGERRPMPVQDCAVSCFPLRAAGSSRQALFRRHRRGAAPHVLRGLPGGGADHRRGRSRRLLPQPHRLPRPRQGRGSSATSSPSTICPRCSAASCERAWQAREATLLLEGITCAACVWLNEQQLARTPGVLAIEINYTTHRARVRWDPARSRCRRSWRRFSRSAIAPSRAAAQPPSRRASARTAARCGVCSWRASG